MKRDYLQKSSPSPQQPRQVEIRELESPVVKVVDTIQYLEIALQIMEKFENGFSSPLEHIEVSIRVDRKKIIKMLTEESGILEFFIQVDPNDQILTCNVPGTTAVYRRKIKDLFLVKKEENDPPAMPW